MTEDQMARIEAIVGRLERLLDRLEPILHRLMANPFLKMGGRR